MSRAQWAWLLAVAVAVTAFQGLSDYFNSWPGGPPAPIFVVTTLVVGASYLAAGLAAGSRRPRERIGLLFMIVGFEWFVPGLTNLRSPVPFTVGNLLQPIYSAGLAHLALAWPSGRLRSRRQRALIVANYGWSLASDIVGTMFWDPRTTGCSSACPANLLLVNGSGRLHNIVDTVLWPGSLVMTAAVVALIVHNWRSARGYSRREMTPLVWVAAPVVAYVVVQDAASNFNLGISDVVVYGIAPLVLVLPSLLLFGAILRVHMARRAVGTALVDLEPGPPPQLLRETLALALGDSTLQLAFRQPSGAYLDTANRVVDTSSPAPGQVITELAAVAQAVLVYDERLRYEPQLLQAALNVANLALQHSRLQAEVKAQLEQVRASRARIIEAGDTARRRLERDLHDGAQQRLVTLTLALGAARERASGTDPELESLLDAASKEAREALVELRELARGIHPAVLTETGLKGALQALVERSPVATTLGGVPEVRFAAPIEATAYFVVSEALANVVKHAGANSAEVRVAHTAGVLAVQVRDDGAGGALLGRGSGLRGLADRIASVGGSLRVDSPPGGGTSIEVEIPCP